MACGCVMLTGILACANDGTTMVIRYREDSTALHYAMLRSRKCKKCYGTDFVLVSDGRPE